MAGHLGVAASTISGLIAPLAKRGLVERGQGAVDRRVVSLRVTEHGYACYRRMEERILVFLTGVFTVLAPETKEALLAGLDGLDGAIGRQRVGAGLPRNGHDTPVVLNGRLDHVR